MAEQKKDKMMDEFSRNLKYYAKLRGISQADMVAETGLPQSSISAYFRGYRYPRRATMEQLANLLNVEVKDLISAPPTLEKVVQNKVESSEIDELITLATQASPNDIKMASDLLRRLNAYREAFKA